MQVSSGGQPERTVYFDYLRVFSAFAVMILHIAAKKWYTTDVNSLDWQIFNFYDSLVRWSVPAFVMISGSLFLNREINLSKIYSKYILRLVTSFIIWSVIYALFSKGTAIDRLLLIIQGHYHMWFVLMMIGLYMCLPVIKSIVNNEKITKYYLFLAFLFAALLPTVVTLCGDFGNELTNKFIQAINGDVNDACMRIVLGYPSYFILGYFLNKISLNKKQRLLIYLLGILGFMATVALDAIVSLQTQTASSHYYGYFSFNVLLESIAVFTLFKYGKYNNLKLNAFIAKLSKYSYGAYLIHVLVFEQVLLRVGLNTLSFTPIFSVPCIGIITFLISFGISALLNQIPIIKKYMV